MFDILIFDFDGTLVNTAPDVHTCCNLTLAQMDLGQISLEQAKLAIGPGPDNFATITLGKNNVHRLDEFIQIFRHHYNEHCLDKTTLFPGIKKLLTVLSGHKMVIASNKPRVYTNVIIEGLGQHSHFDLLVGPEDVNQLKPHPEMLVYAIKKLGGNADTTLMIGDTDNDILAAQAAKVTSCAVCWGYAPRETLVDAKPDFFIKHPSDLIEIVYNGRLVIETTRKTNG